MSLAGLLVRRALLGLATAWVVLTSVFALFTLTEDWVLQGQVGSARFAGVNDPEAIEAIRNEYFASRGLDGPLYEVYLEWMANMATLDWGVSEATGEAVFPLVTGAVLRTASYVLPAVVLAILAGVVIGLYAALRPESRVANGSVTSAYLLFALPNFWVGGMAVSLLVGNVIDHPGFLYEHVLPVLLAFTTLLGGYVSYARAHSREYAGADFVTLVRAKGGSSLRVAVHVVRNAAIPFVSMLFTEALGLLVLAAFVIEVLFGIDGFGLLLLEAVNERDLPVLLGGTVVVIGVGVVGNVLQDVAYGSLDPRVEVGSRSGN